MLTQIMMFLATKIGRYVFAGGVFVALVGAFSAHQRHIGATKAVAKIERATHEAVKLADRAGSASRNKSSRGVLDPYARIE